MRTAFHDPSMLRLHAARAIAWSVLLIGWVGLGSLAQMLAAGPAAAFASLAAWLIVLGVLADRIGTWRLARWQMCLSLAVAAALAASLLFEVRHGAGMAALLPGMAAWAGLVALASSAVRACRLATRTLAGPPVGAAAAGAALAWLVLGDITDVRALVPRLICGGVAACVALSALLPRGAGQQGACRAGLFDCSLPNWSTAAWRTPSQWPLMIGSLVMLPMMCSLPLMVSLCRGESISPQAVVAVHFAAMFMPALLMARWRIGAHAAACLCATLLALGALALLFVPPPWTWWGVVLTHGAAWSAAWSAHLTHRPGGRIAGAAPLASTALNALLTMLIGLGVSAFGLQALAGWHLGIGLAGLVALAMTLIGPRFATSPIDDQETLAGSRVRRS